MILVHGEPCTQWRNYLLALLERAKPFGTKLQTSSGCIKRARSKKFGQPDATNGGGTDVPPQGDEQTTAVMEVIPHGEGGQTGSK
uniref:Uncharacterized protein n=1 Tax=Acrobeloides nanus TaxID=290746 RepID=A0A914E0A9_9BILA